MKVLVNFIPIKKGGGQQVASNFVKQLERIEDVDFVFIVTKNTIIEKLVNANKKWNVISLDDNILKRIIFSKYKLNKLCIRYNIDIIYTMFGPGLFSKHTISVTGCAYSNLFFPKIQFWQDYKLLDRIKFKIRDYYRLKATLKSDFIIFENKSMMEQCWNLYNISPEKTKLILPSISEYPVNHSSSFDLRLSKLDSSAIKIGLITGYHKNKNIEIVFDCLKHLKKTSTLNVQFVITISNSNPNIQDLKNKLALHNLQNNVVFFDSIRPNEIPLLLNAINGVGLFSLLESFSNNIIEAWTFNKPLFISDEKWSRGICNNAAIYVNRNSGESISKKISEYFTNDIVRENYKLSLQKELPKYPSPNLKVVEQVNFLKEVNNEIND